MTKMNQCDSLKHCQPVDGEPFGGTCFPEAKANDGACKKQYDVPWNLFKIVDIKDTCNKEKNG